MERLGQLLQAAAAEPSGPESVRLHAVACLRVRVPLDWLAMLLVSPALSIGKELDLLSVSHTQFISKTLHPRESSQVCVDRYRLP